MSVERIIMQLRSEGSRVIKIESPTETLLLIYRKDGTVERRKIT